MTLLHQAPVSKENPTAERLPLIGLTPDQLTTLAVEECGMPRYAGRQIADWLYVKCVQSIDEMTNLSKKHRQALAERYYVGREEPIRSQRSQDGTVKYLFAVGDSAIEAVYIPEEERATLCVSSQVGCKMNCLFCMTGKQGFSGHLTAHQIINQVLSIPESSSLTNIVYMGMGEPLDNVQQVLQSIECLIHPDGLAWSPKRITVSTIGVEPGLSTFLQESKCHLAISLHNPLPDERHAIMPVQKAFPIEQVLRTVRQYDWSHQRRLTFEYIVFSGLNDTRRHMNALVSLLKDLPCRVNLIRYHRIPHIDLPASDLDRMERMRDYLTGQGVVTTIRSSRGEDILAACGMLSSKEEEERRLG